MQPSSPPTTATLESPSPSSSSPDRSSESSPAPTRRDSAHSLPSYIGDVCYPGAESERSCELDQLSIGLSRLSYSVQPRTEPHYNLAHEGTARAAPYNPTAHVVPTFNAIYTDDVSTKLNDRIRRRCFNCCTTDTSTWRRSSLNPGKVVSKKTFFSVALSDGNASCAISADCSSVHTIAQGQSSFLISAVLSLRRRSKYAHPRLHTVKSLLSVHHPLTSITTQPSPLYSRGQTIHMQPLVEGPYLKYSPGFPPPQLRQVSASPRGSPVISSDPFTPSQRLSCTVLTAYNFQRHLLFLGPSTLPPFPLSKQLDPREHTL